MNLFELREKYPHGYNTNAEVSTSDLVGTGLGPAPSGYGDEYDQLFASNPYRNLNYKKSFWQNIWSQLGFRTGADAFRENAQVNAAEYDAAIFSMIQQNQFNSPQRQAQRMRAAGLNPDLQGVGDVASAASPVEDPNGMPDANETDEATKAASLVTGFASNCLNALGLASNLFKTSAEIKNINTAMKGIQLDNNKKAVDLIDQIIVGSVPLSAWSSQSGVDDYFHSIDLSNYGFAPDFLDSANKILEDRRDSFKNNADILESVYKRYGFVKGINETKMTGLVPDKMSPYSGDDMFNVFLEAYSNIARQVLDLEQVNELVEQRDLVPQEQLNREITGDIMTDNLSAKNGENFGQITGQTESYFAKVQNIVAKEKSRMYGNLAIKANAGDESAKMMLHALALQDMLQFEVSGGADFSLLKGLSSIAESVFGEGNHHKSGSTRNKSRGFGFNFDFNVKTK